MYFRGSLQVLILLLIIVGCGADYRSKSMSIHDFSFATRPPPPLCMGSKPTGEVGIKAIYGDDDRLEWYEASPISVAWARSTVALMYANQLSDQGSRYRVTSQTHGQASNLCPGVSFSEQPSAAYCSGFLVAEDLIVTAGHCVKNEADCTSTFFIFDYSKTSPSQTQYFVDKKNVYRCQELVAQNIFGSDYAVVKLDKAVQDRTPLNIRRSGLLPLGHELVLVGYPSGIPSKIADGGIVRQSSADLIVASVDAFAGNSGSPVINMSTGLVEGILVAGEPDYLNQGSCQIENRCGSNCQGEQITPINKIISYIPNITYDAPGCDGN